MGGGGCRLPSGLQKWAAIEVVEPTNMIVGQGGVGVGSEQERGEQK